MNSVVAAYKPIGFTPLDLIKKLKYEYPDYASEKIGYAGRLDPMAEGLLLLMIGEGNKKAERYQKLPKQYQFDVLFGVETDSFDLLGLVQSRTTPGKVRNIKELKSKARKYIKGNMGEIIHQYPPFSSKPVRGKPLYWWARSNKLSEIDLPQKKIEIFEFRHANTFSIDIAQLEETIIKRISKVKGDFRQEEIMKSWEQYFAKTLDSELPILRFFLKCSSGTYIRTLAHELGRFAKRSALAFNIKRIAQGKYKLEDALRVG